MINVVAASMAGTPRPMRTVHQILLRYAEHTPNGIAITAPGREPLTYQRLLQRVNRHACQLAAIGVRRTDRVAIVLPNGPETAVAVLSVMLGATCAPLNPGYRQAELEFYLADLRAKALLIQAGFDSPARQVARDLGIRVVDVLPDRKGPAGALDLDGIELQDVEEAPASVDVPDSDDVALVTHTSGTTSRPKIVSLTHLNLCLAAHEMASGLDLTAADRCINILPLFHSHGLTTLLAVLESGGGICCTPGFDLERFFDWLVEYKPTWYTAVPTIHQAILASVPEHRDVIARTPLRLLRSGSASMPRPLITEIERVFDVPLIEAYAMSECCNITSNPLPPGARKVGSVGLPAGPEVAVVDDLGRRVSAGTVGEVAIRGEIVMSGYENNPEANDRAFFDGWFRTGDQGYFDEDGYLYLTGRIKEVIDRGGEKISPIEIDSVLHEHPAVAKAFAFAVPHPRLGSDVGAVITLHPDYQQRPAEELERGIRGHVRSRLSDFKVPRTIVFVDEIPVGPTGKVQRVALAEMLGLTGESQAARATDDGPRTPVEQALAEIWRELLQVQYVGRSTDFFRLGGESILAAQLLVRIRSAFGRSIPSTDFFREPTIARLAEMLAEPVPERPFQSIVPIQPRGTEPPFFCVHPVGGHVLGLRHIARHLGDDQPFYGLQALGLDGDRPPLTTIESMATHYLREVRSIQPRGPYYLGGYSFGGSVALEMARLLQGMGETVALLAVLDTVLPNVKPRWQLATARRFFTNLPGWLRDFAARPVRERKALVREHLQLLVQRGATAAGVRLGGGDSCAHLPRIDTSSWPAVWQQVTEANYGASKRYVPGSYSGPVVLFRASRQPLAGPHDTALGWSCVATGRLEIREVPGHHLSMVEEPHVGVLASALRSALEASRLRLALGN